MLRRQQFTADKARIVLTGMILSDDALRQVALMYTEGLFRVDFADEVASWCINYFREYNIAPRRQIESIFYQHADNMEDTDRECVERLLSKLSEEYEREGEKFNAAYAVDVARELFKRNHLQTTAERVLSMVEEDDVEGAEHRMVSFSAVEMPTGRAVNPYTDEDAIRRAFSVTTEPLFRFPGAIGRMVNAQLVRGSFMAIMGREKIGKTWYLDCFGHQAAKCRCNVAFFSVGDMTEEDMIVRKHTTLSRKPTDPELLGLTIAVPEKIVETDTEDDEGNFGCTGYSVEYTKEDVKELLSVEEAIKMGQVFGNRLRGKDYKLFTFPNSTVNVEFIRQELDILASAELWIPDVIIIDYADILLPEPAAPGEFRHQQNHTWRTLRSLAQERHCFVLTATQADAASYDPSVDLSMRNFSEDKRKLSHVTAMLGLNQTDTEKKSGVLRMNWIVLRKGRFTSSNFLYLLQCLEKGQTLIKSYFLPQRKAAD